MSEVQSKFEGWAIVDVLGHQRFFGYVSTEYFGTATFFRVETPKRPPVERVLATEEYVSPYGTCPAGARIVHEGKMGATRLIGADSIYMIAPTAQDRVMEELNESDRCSVLSVTNPDGTPRKPSDDDYPF